jgi:hypothetical protein
MMHRVFWRACVLCFAGTFVAAVGLPDRRLILRSIQGVPPFFFKHGRVSLPIDYLAGNASAFVVSVKSPSGSAIRPVGPDVVVSDVTKLPASATQLSLACRNWLFSCADVTAEVYLELRLPPMLRNVVGLHDSIVSLVAGTIAGQHAALRSLEEAVRAWNPDRTPLVLTLTGKYVCCSRTLRCPNKQPPSLHQPGPTQSGKSETAKAIAKALGLFGQPGYVAFNFQGSRPTGLQLRQRIALALHLSSGSGSCLVVLDELSAILQSRKPADVEYARDVLGWLSDIVSRPYTFPDPLTHAPISAVGAIFILISHAAQDLVLAHVGSEELERDFVGKVGVTVDVAFQPFMGDDGRRLSHAVAHMGSIVSTRVDVVQQT